MNDVYQGVHLRMCGEILRCLGSNTCIHIQTSPERLAQWRDHIKKLSAHVSHAVVDLQEFLKHGVKLQLLMFMCNLHQIGIVGREGMILTCGIVGK